MNAQRKSSEEWRDGVLMAVHDLKNYLNCIHGYAYMMEKNGADAGRWREYLRRLVTASRKAGALAEELERPPGADSSLKGRRASFILEDLVEESVAAFESLFWDKGILLERDIPRQLSRVRGDREGLGRVVANLLSNALKFTQPGGKVAVEVRRGDREVRVAVRDTGIGIPEDRKSKIFDKFYQVLPHNHGSKGLGLYIARRIVQAHDGRIAAESGGLGRGSTLWFGLFLDGQELPRPG